MNTRLDRRTFLQRTSLSATALWLAVPVRTWGKISPNEKLNIGVIGVRGQGGFSISNLKDQNLVAFCDVDANNLNHVAQQFPAAKTYRDFRRLVDQDDLDAIVVATPDHTHAVASVAALSSGRHLYCEKPLTRTISEARVVTELARKKKLVTQIGTQIHAGTNYRRVVELVQSGAIGPVREVHVWVGARYGGMKRPTDTPPVPEQLDWDLWLGPVESRPYHPNYAPFMWRNWWAFGGGSLADFGCHFMDLPHWALDLRHPFSAEPVEGPPVDAEVTPLELIVRYEYPARGDKPPVTLTWYHGGRYPKALLDEEQYQQWRSGVLFIGAKGRLLADYSRRQLLPVDEFKGFSPPAPFIKDSIGHHKEWVEAIKTGGTTTCNFDYSGPLTEAALLGNVAYRVGRKLEWNAAKMRATNCPEARQYIEHRYRKGWKI